MILGRRSNPILFIIIFLDLLEHCFFCFLLVLDACFAGAAGNFVEEKPLSLPSESDLGGGRDRKRHRRYRCCCSWICFACVCRLACCLFLCLLLLILLVVLASFFSYFVRIYASVRIAPCRSFRGMCRPRSRRHDTITNGE